LKKYHYKIIELVDLLYFAIIIIIPQFNIIPEILIMFLSLPYFILMPYYIGISVIFLLSKVFQLFWKLIISKTYVNNLIECWSIGIITLFSLGIFLQFINSFNIYIYASIIFILLTFSRIKITKYTLNINSITNKIKMRFGSSWILLLIIFFGLIPPIFQSQLWSFPLKWESDGFGIGQLSKIIINLNFIDVYSAIHLPILSILLSIPCMLFNLEPSHYLWGLPFLIYPIFSICAYLLAYKYSNSILISLFTSIFSMFFFGDGNNVFNLFMILPRNLLCVLFLFAMYYVIPENNSHISLNIKDGLFLGLISILLYSTITFAISPSFNKLPQISIIIVLIIPFSFIILSYKDIKILRFLIFLICISFIIAFNIVFYYDINFPNLGSITFMTSLIGICSSLSLIIFYYKYKININTSIISILVLIMLIYHQLGLILNLLIMGMIILNYILQKLSRLNLMIKYSTLIMILMLSFFSISDFHSFIPVSDSTRYYTSIIESTFTHPILIMFFLGCIISVKQKNFKNNIASFIAAFILSFYLFCAEMNINFAITRLLEFLPFFLSYFAASLFQLLEIFFDFDNKYNVTNFFYLKGSHMKIKESSIITCIFFIFLLPSLVQPYTSFLQNSNKEGTPPYTFSNYEYKTAIWIDKHIDKNVLIVSDTFTTLIMTGLTGNAITLNYRMIYDAKGNTHVIYRDKETLSWIKNLFITSNITYAEICLNNIWNKYSNAFELNQKIIDAKLNINTDVIIIFSGRTSQWVTAKDFSDVIFPQNFILLPIYNKFFKTNSFTLLYESEDQIYVFKWSKK